MRTIFFLLIGLAVISAALDVQGVPLLALIFAFFAFLSWMKRRNRRRIAESWRVALETYRPALMRNLRRHVTPDEYGALDGEGFTREVERFAAARGLTFGSDGKRVMKLVADTVELWLHEEAEGGDGPFDGTDPIEYEHHCARVLRHHGWDATTTKGSGDQGIDLVAQRGGETVVLQCKLYSSPVGNKAVQEAFAGKGFAAAGHAAVVTNNSYTRSARELASTLGVHLLHDTDLPTLAELTGVTD